MCLPLALPCMLASSMLFGRTSLHHSRGISGLVHSSNLAVLHHSPHSAEAHAVPCEDRMQGRAEPDSSFKPEDMDKSQHYHTCPDTCTARVDGMDGIQEWTESPMSVEAAGRNKIAPWLCGVQGDGWVAPANAKICATHTGCMHWD